jgi:GxxExxY protein
MAELLFKEEVYAIVGAAMETYNQLGPGFLEAVYQEALELELEERGIPFHPQQELNILYKGRKLKKTYITDFLAYDKIMVEIKALNHLTPNEVSQLINQMKATGCKVGVLINFGHEDSLEWRRYILTDRNQANLGEKPLKRLAEIRAD